MAEHVHRVTMFKLPQTEDIETMIEQYRILEASNQKVQFAFLQSVFHTMVG